MSKFAEFVVEWAFPISIVIILVIFVGREFLHCSYYYHIGNEVQQLQESIQILELSVVAALKLLGRSDLTTLTYETVVGHASSCYEYVLLSWDFLETLHLGLPTKFLSCVCICMMQIFEIRMIHPATASGAERRFNVYIRNSYPVTTVMFHCALFCCSCGAYWGVLSTRAYIIRAVDVLTLW